MANIVKFYDLTPSEFNGTVKNNNYLYFVAEKDSNLGALYKGSTLIADSYSIELIKNELNALEEIVQGHLEISAGLEQRISNLENDLAEQIVFFNENKTAVKLVRWI